MCQNLEKQSQRECRLRAEVSEPVVRMAGISCASFRYTGVLLKEDGSNRKKPVPMKVMRHC